MSAPGPVDAWQQRLVALRMRLAWSQRRLAKELKVSHGAVSQWESGHRGIPGPVKKLIELYESKLAGAAEPER